MLNLLGSKINEKFLIHYKKNNKKTEMKFIN